MFSHEKVGLGQNHIQWFTVHRIWLVIRLFCTHFWICDWRAQLNDQLNLIR